MSEVRGLGFYNENGIIFQDDEKKHITENIRRIITTRPGERVGNLKFGSNVTKYIFDKERSIDDLISEIVRSVEYWEPRVKVESCTLHSIDDKDIINIDLEVKIKDSSEKLKMNIGV